MTSMKFTAKNPLSVEKGEDAVGVDADEAAAVAVEGAEDNVTKDFLDINKYCYGDSPNRTITSRPQM